MCMDKQQYVYNILVLQISGKLFKYAAKGDLDAVKKALGQDADPNWQNKKHNVCKQVNNNMHELCLKGILYGFYN